MSMQSVSCSLSEHPRGKATLTALLACLLVAGNHGLLAANPAAPDLKPASPEPMMEDGFTRESLSEINAPESIPPTDPPESPASLPRHHHALVRHPRHARHLSPTHGETREAAVKPHHRNPVESFVYAWNGWVIRTFHTKTGTVLFDRIGARA